MAVFPSTDGATDMSWLVLPTASVPTSFGGCWKVRVGASLEKPACDARYRS